MEHSLEGACVAVIGAERASKVGDTVVGFGVVGDRVEGARVF